MITMMANDQPLNKRDLILLHRKIDLSSGLDFQVGLCVDCHIRLLSLIR